MSPGYRAPEYRPLFWIGESLSLVFSVIEVMGGTALLVVPEPSLSKAGGLFAVAHGYDNFQASVNSLSTGRHVQAESAKVVQQSLESVGVDRSWAAPAGELTNGVGGSTLGLKFSSKGLATIPKGKPAPAAVPPSVVAPGAPAPGRIPLPMVQEPIPLGPVRTVPGVQVNQGHVFHGEINRRGNAVGYHHRPGGQDATTARVTEIVDAPNAQGVYTGQVEVFNPATNTWVSKELPSSFYPDTWTQGRVLLEVRGAYGARNVINGNRWEGTSPSGIRIRGYLNPDGSINTAFPIP